MFDDPQDRAGDRQQLIEDHNEELQLQGKATERAPSTTDEKYSRDAIFANTEKGSGAGPGGEKKSATMDRDGLTPIKVWAYSVGHFNNDLCASMWFIYLTYYLVYVVHLEPPVAGAAVLSGQFADGFMTPAVGILSDRFSSPCGKRTPWYIFGTLFVAPTFLGIFMYPGFVNEKVTDDNGDEHIANPSLQQAWYITLPALFNIGWASVQIANMSIVNNITLSNRMRDKLSNNRNGFTSTANITVLGLAAVLFVVVKDPVTQFQILAIICVGTGLCTSGFYMYQVREVPLGKEAVALDAQYKRQLKIESGLMSENDPVEEMTGDELKTAKKGKTWKDWLKLETFYIYGFVYMVVRVAINVTMTLQPFYLKSVTLFGDPNNEKESPIQVAIVPLISYIGQLFFSLFLQRILTEKLRNRFLPLLVALVLITVGSLPFAFLTGDDNNRWLVYPLAFVQGLGLIICLNTSTSLISDVIGNDAANAAFVYGIYSFFDKMANGLLLFWIVGSYSKGHPNELKWIIAIVPVICALFAYGLSFFGHKYFSHKLAKITGLK